MLLAFGECTFVLVLRGFLVTLPGGVLYLVTF
jgi:hypothetical protein